MAVTVSNVVIPIETLNRKNKLETFTFIGSNVPIPIGTLYGVEKRTVNIKRFKRESRGEEEDN